MYRISNLIFFFAFWFIAGSDSWAGSDVRETLLEPLFENALNYDQIDRIPACQERGNTIIYHECRDSRQIYDLAIKNAKEKGQPLMVVFGFNTCPACLNLEKTVFQLDPPPRNGDIIKYFSKPFVQSFKKKPKPMTIGVVRIHSRSAHGLTLADELGVTELAQARGWHRVWSPFILIVNPETSAMHSESYWEKEEVYCDWFSEFAVGIEKVGLVPNGDPFTERERCKI